MFNVYVTSTKSKFSVGINIDASPYTTWIINYQLEWKSLDCEQLLLWRICWNYWAISSYILWHSECDGNQIDFKLHKVKGFHDINCCCCCCCFPMNCQISTLKRALQLWPWNFKEKCPKAVPRHIQNHVVWSWTSSVVWCDWAFNQMLLQWNFYSCGSPHMIE